MTSSISKSILGIWSSSVFSDLKSSIKDVFNVPHNQKSAWLLNGSYEIQATAKNNISHADLNVVSYTLSLPKFYKRFAGEIT